MRPSSLAFASLLVLLVPACGGSDKKVEKPVASGCPAGMIEIEGKAGKPSFCLDRTEVTVGNYLECVGKALCTSASEGRDCNRDSLSTQTHPINCIDANQAEAYCGAIGKRLPTEDEWDWAARGGKSGPRDPGAGTCWSGGMPQRGTCPTDRRGADESSLGVVDLVGNVAEWTSSGTDDARTVRGGAWSSTAPGDLRPDARHVVKPTLRNPGVGFRCAKTPLGKTRSMIVAMPMPPPMQRVISAVDFPVRSSSSRAAPTRMAPVAPSG
jgi:hypothetical protein